MDIKKRVPDEFGIIVPKDNGVNWVKQSGGFSCTQHFIEGIFIPLGKLKHNLGNPSWKPDSIDHMDYINNIQPSKIPSEVIDFPKSVVENDGFKSEEQCYEWIDSSRFSGTAELFEFVYNLNSHPDRPTFDDKITSLDINPKQIPTKDYENLPNSIKENGFDSTQEYLNWKENSERYGWIELWDDAYRFAYGVFENLDSDPRERWDSSEELWNKIDSYFPFEYERIDYEKHNQYDIPFSQPAIQPIRITSAEDPDHKFSTDFNGLENEIVVLLGPNAD